MKNYKLQIANYKLTSGFTLVELLVSIGILIVIFGIMTINISPIPSNTLQSANLDLLISDIRSQQTLAMTNNSHYGIFFESDKYTLFKGDTYINGANGNYAVNLDSGITFTNISFPNSSIIFLPGSGDVNGYSASTDSITLTSDVTGKSTNIQINKYGATY